MEIVIKGTPKEIADLLSLVTNPLDDKKLTLSVDELPAHSHAIDTKSYQGLCHEHLINSYNNGTDPLIGFPDQELKQDTHSHAVSIWHDPEFRSKFPNGAPINGLGPDTLIGHVPTKR